MASDLDKKIDELVSNSHLKTLVKKDFITFYWTRKNPDLLLNILDSFTKQNHVVFDPFLGSAPILFSIDKAEKNLKFIGNEINEMPLSFINFNLASLSGDDLKNIKKKFMSFYDEYIHYYEYTTSSNENTTLSKVIIDRDESEINIKKFIFNDKVKTTLTNKNNVDFDLCSQQYLNKSSELKNINIKQDIELTTNSRIAIKKGMKLSHLFNPINYYILTKYSEKFKNDELMITLLSSILHLCRLTDLKSQSQFPYWVPKKDIVERNILLLILKKVELIVKSKQANTLNLSLVNKYTELKDFDKSILILNKPSQFITNLDIPNKSIDCVITDPPYFDQVAYSEYLKIWEHFCHYKSSLKDELIHSNRALEPSSEELYLENLTKCFSVTSKKLKDDGLVIIFFKDSKPKNIYLFLKAMEQSNLSYLRSVHINKKKFTYKQNTTKDTTVIGECLFFFNKNITKLKIDKQIISLSNKELNEMINQVIKKFSIKYIKDNGDASLGELYDNGLLYSLYKNNILNKIKNAQIIVDVLNLNLKLLPNRKYTIHNEKT